MTNHRFPNRTAGLVGLSALLFMLAVVGQGCVVSKNPITGKKRAYAYAWDEEVRIGNEADAQIISQYGLYDDDQLAAYVDRIGQDLLEVSHLRRPGADPQFSSTPFAFRVLDSPVVNAFALPGGYVYVTRGLLAHLENEAQLAVVLGHEIGHVAARHASQRALSQQARQIGLLAGAVGGQAMFGKNVAQNILDLGSVANQFITLSYGRDDERESDDLGVEYATLAGYQASEGAEFFRTLERLGEQSGQEIPGFMSTHPDPGERNQTIQNEGARWAGQVDRQLRVDREALLNQIDGIVYGENPRHGYVTDGSFIHPDLGFRFPVPAGFGVSNQPTRVVMIPENQEAYMLMEIDSEHGSAREAAGDLTANESITVVRSGLGEAGGLPSRFVVVDATTQDGQKLRLRFQFIDYADAVYAFTGVTTRARYSAYENAFITTMHGFRPLRTGPLVEVQPNRIRLETAGANATLAQLVSGGLPEGVTSQTLAILNQVGADQRIEAGRTFKVVQ